MHILTPGSQEQLMYKSLNPPVISSNELGVKHKDLFNISEHCQAVEDK